jgi:farnesyl-diphosphate farnesyltransferase
VEGPATSDGVAALLNEVPDGDELDAERVVLTSLPQALSMLESLDVRDRQLVRSVVVALTQGMEMDLTDLAPREPCEIRAVQDAAQLDAYVYGVAGCVGEFWTAISISRQPALKHWDASHMSPLGARFGKALQMTNVLRDIPQDVRNGRCYLPRDQLAEVGLVPMDLLDSGNASKARPVLVQNLRLALDHYQCAGEYLLALPRRCFRLRLAVAWPLLMGLATLVRLARNPDWLSLGSPSRVSRAWVYRMMALSSLCGWSNTALRWWIGRLKRQLEKSL